MINIVFLNFLVSDSKYASKSNVLRSRRAYETIVDHLEEHNFVLTTSKASNQLNDHYRHTAEQTGDVRLKRHTASNVNNWNRRKQFIRYVQSLCGKDGRGRIQRRRKRSRRKRKIKHFYLTFFFFSDLCMRWKAKMLNHYFFRLASSAYRFAWA